MKGTLTLSQINYVIFHLSHHVSLTPELRSKFIFGHTQDAVTGHIIFPLSEKPFAPDQVVVMENIPVLFPMNNVNDMYFIDSQSNLVFCHDLLKSIFYLLSGYQEYENPHSKDKLGRYSFGDSVQARLNFAAIPVVNYYFGFMIRGLEEFAEKQNFRIRRKRLFETYGLVLSHDIDYADLYTKNFIIYKAKEIFGLRPSRLPAGKNLKLLIKGLKEYLTGKNNPYWNFEFLREAEREHNFKSVFFFLDHGLLHHDAYYSFTEKRFLDLFIFLKAEACEIGLHGPVRSVNNPGVLKESLKKLQDAGGAEIVGIRQHRLLWEHPLTGLIQQQAGLKYDTTLGFAPHEGFRNSYCHPFRLYDFENDKMMHLWEFPLNVMDVTLFSYRDLHPDVAFEKCRELIHEVKRFGGVFNFLWHNSFFDEDTYPGVTFFYKRMLAHMKHSGAENILGKDLLDKMEIFSNE